MSPQANVQSIEALDRLRQGVARFDTEAPASLRQAHVEIWRMQDWLRERLAHWEREVREATSALQSVLAALAACRASGYTDPDTGQVYEPDCTAEEHDVAQAEARLHHAQAELANTRRWANIFSRSVTAYFDQATQLSRTLHEILPRGKEFLSNKVADLKAFAAQSGSTGDGASASSRASGGAGTGQGSAAAGAGDWVSTGMHSVPLSQIDLSDSPVSGPGDFHKVSYQQMLDGLARLEAVVRPAMSRGADGDYFSRLDMAQGLDYEHGYRAVYDAFYGSSHIHLNLVGNKYQVVNGYHRIYAAQRMGLSSIPAVVVAQKPSP